MQLEAYINGSLPSLIATGTRRPSDNDEGLARVEEKRQKLRLVG